MDIVIAPLGVGLLALYFCVVFFISFLLLFFTCLLLYSSLSGCQLLLLYLV